MLLTLENNTHCSDIKYMSISLLHDVKVI